MDLSDRGFEAAGLLDGLSAEERGERLALLRSLAETGTPLDEMKQAAAEDRLALLPIEAKLRADASYTARELAELSGLSEQFILRQRVAAGLPRPQADECAFSEDNLAAARALKVLLDAGVSEDQMIALVRVTGRAMAQMADAGIELLVGVLLRAGDSERALAERIAQVSEGLVPQLAPLVEAPLRVQLYDRVRREVIGRIERATGQLPAAQDIAVGFADLVGFTTLGYRVSLEEVDRVVVRFGELAAETARSPVRLVKLIGDAAMLVAPEPEDVVNATTALLAAAPREGLPALRAGIAAGPALRRAGDYYGHTVNLASRACGAAAPGTIAAEENVRDATANRPWKPLGPTPLKGIDVPVELYALQASEGEGSR